MPEHMKDRKRARETYSDIRDISETYWQLRDTKLATRSLWVVMTF